jgi:1,2-phenylacetyl-CoA epoxidase catalytic subunit
VTIDYAAEREKFFQKQRDADQLAKLFGIFRVGEHHAVITIGDWLKSTPELEVKDGFARLIWDEARHTRIWTERMKELIGEDAVRRLYPDPRHVDFRNDQYFRLWDEYARAEVLPQRLAYIYVVDAWAALAYDVYLKYVDPVTKWHLQTILHDENFHVEFGRKMAERYVTSERDRELLRREEEKIGRILAEVTDGFLRVDV